MKEPTFSGESPAWIEPRLDVCGRCTSKKHSMYDKKTAFRTAAAVRLPHGSASRCLTQLTEGQPAVGELGHELLHVIPDRLNRKMKLVSLNEKAAQFLAKAL